MISGIEVFEDRIYVIDAADSARLIKYSDKENQLYEVCDDLLPKFVTSNVLLDYNQICLVDKFGQFSILRTPSTVDTDF